MSFDESALREALKSVGIDRMRVMAKDIYGVRSPSRIRGGKAVLVEAIVDAVRARNTTPLPVKQVVEQAVTPVEALQRQVATLTRQVERLSQRLQDTVLMSISAWEVTQQDVDLLRLKVLPNTLYNDPGVRAVRKHEVHKMWFKLRTGEDLEDSMTQFSFKDQDMDILCADGNTVTATEAKIAHNKAMSDARKRT